MRGLAALSLVVCACGASIEGDVNATPDGNPPLDPDAEDIDAGLGLFGPPIVVPGANTNADEDDGTLSSTGLEMVFSLEEAGDNNRKHLYILTRMSTTDPFAGPPTRLPFNQTGAQDQTPRFSDDDLTLFFATNRDPNTSGLDIYRVTRPNVGGAFGTPTVVAGIDDPARDDKWFMPCAGNRFLMISNRGGVGEDIYEGVLGMGAPVRVAELSSAQSETGTFLTADCLTVYFASQRTGDNRIHIATRTAVDQPWGMPTEVTDFMPTPGENQEDPWLSADGRTFALSSNRNGNKDVFLSVR